VAWGRNAETFGRTTNMLLAETNLTLHDRDTWFGRLEVGQKSAHDLDLHQLDRVFTVAKLQGGYTRYLGRRAGVTPGIGAAVSASVVPEFLRTVYGARLNGGVAVFLTLRPAAHPM
jgi:hypothetical protein